MVEQKKKAKIPQTHKYSYYQVIAGEKIERKNLSCPKCGPGVFLANHKDGRKACGKCGYTEKPAAKQ